MNVTHDQCEIIQSELRSELKATKDALAVIQKQFVQKISEMQSIKIACIKGMQSAAKMVSDLDEMLTQSYTNFKNELVNFGLEDREIYEIMEGLPSPNLILEKIDSLKKEIYGPCGPK